MHGKKCLGGEGAGDGIGNRREGSCSGNTWARVWGHDKYWGITRGTGLEKWAGMERKVHDELGRGGGNSVFDFHLRNVYLPPPGAAPPIRSSVSARVDRERHCGSRFCGVEGWLRVFNA